MFIFQTHENTETIKENLKNPRDGYALLKFELERAAENGVTLGPFSLTFSPAMAVTGDPHDYFSTAPYWWQDIAAENPETAPYIQRDGERNPECRKYRHKHDFNALAQTVQTLCVAGYFFDRSDYIKRAGELLKIWFVDKETRMNPHFKYAQAIKNVCEGRGIGIIELAPLNRIVYALGYMEATRGQEHIINDVNAWLEQMLDWLLTSKNGLEESRNGNNHETYYNVHIGTYGLWLGRRDVVNMVCDNFRDRIVPHQIMDDGAMPRELKRTNSLGYSIYNLEALALVCEIGRMNGVDLWNYSVGERSVSKAIDYILPTLINPYDPASTWKHRQMRNIHLTDKFFLQLGAVRLNRSELGWLNNSLRDGRTHWRQGSISPLCLLEGYEF